MKIEHILGGEESLILNNLNIFSKRERNRMAKFHVLIVEDEADIQQLVSYNLIKSGLHVSCADSAEDALTHLRDERFDCILLDIMLPAMNGLELCATVRQNVNCKNYTTPIVMMTAKGEEEDIVVGLENGADDYITKPFSPKVLIARVKACIRRAGSEGSSDEGERETIINVDNILIDRGRHEVSVDGEPLQLTITEFGILALLAAKPGWVFTRQQIIDSVRGYDFLVTPRAMDVQIFGLRKKMGQAGQVIETVRGIGYRFKSTISN